MSTPPATRSITIAPMLQLPKLLAVGSFALLAGCASSPVRPLQATDPATRAEVLVYREHALNAGAVSLTVGAGNDAFAVLEDQQFVIAELPAGRHVLFVRARSAEPTTREVQLAPGQRACFRALADPINIARALVPGWMLATGYRFMLDPAPCPSRRSSEAYEQVPVVYGRP
jgi:hypothetical protein